MEPPQQHDNFLSSSAIAAGIAENKTVRRAERDRFAKAIGIAEIERDASFADFAPATRGNRGVSLVATITFRQVRAAAEGTANKSAAIAFRIGRLQRPATRQAAAERLSAQRIAFAIARRRRRLTHGGLNETAAPVSQGGGIFAGQWRGLIPKEPHVAGDIRVRDHSRAAVNIHLNGDWTGKQRVDGGIR